MRDPSLALRVAVAQLISAQVPPVPVYDMQTADDATFPRVVIEGVTTGVQRRSKCGFGGDWNVQVKVSASFKGRVNSKEVEDIVDRILEKTVPFRTADYPDIDGFSIWNVDASVISTLTYEDKVRKYIDKNIQITYSLTEN